MGIMTGKFFKIKCPLKIKPIVKIAVDKNAMLTSLNPMNFFKLFLKKKARKKKAIENAVLPKSILPGYAGFILELIRHDAVQLAISLNCHIQ